VCVQGESEGGKSLTSGGLGVWDGVRWSLLSNVAVQGTVTCLAVAGHGEGGGSGFAPGHVLYRSSGDRGHLLYIAGRFAMVGRVSALNIAVYNHLTHRWSALGGGLRARDVFALAVSRAVGDQGHSVFAVGSISHAGSIVVGNVAEWRHRSETWHPMRNVNGLVRAAAVMHRRLYIGGDFTVAGAQPAAGIAYTLLDHPGPATTEVAEVEWRQVGAGLQGNVHVLQAIAGCLYVGGRIDRVADDEGIKPANNIARWCVRSATGDGTLRQRQERWEAVKGLDTSGGSVLAIAPADSTLPSDLVP